MAREGTAGIPHTHTFVSFSLLGCDVALLPVPATSFATVAESSPDSRLHSLHMCKAEGLPALLLL